MGIRFGILFGMERSVRRYRDAGRRDIEIGRRFMRGCFERGVFFQNVGHAIGRAGICAAHSAADIDWALNRMDGVFQVLRVA